MKNDTLRNSFDPDINFTDVNEAKNYFLIDDTTEWFSEDDKAFNGELTACEDLSEVADVLIRYSGTLGNGSHYTVG